MKDSKTLPLSGADYFHLLLDRHMRKYTNTGNIGRFALKVKGRITKADLQQKIDEEEIFIWIRSVSFYSAFPFSIPNWLFKKQNEIPVYEYTLDLSKELPEQIFKRDISVRQSPLIHFDLVHDSATTLIILSWHHALMDAHGAEMLMKIVAGKIQKPDFASLFPKSIEEKKIVEQLNKAREAKNFILSVTPKFLTSLLKEKPQRQLYLHYKIIDFNNEDTFAIAARAKELGLRFGLSPLYLAATTRSLLEILKSRKSFSGDFWIPVPQDQRLRGTFGPIISNHVSFLFYKLTETDLTTLKTTVNSLSAQMIKQIKEGTTKTYAEMMRTFRRLPLSIYSSLVKGPTKGAISSFFFSDTGDSLKDLDTFLNYPIEDAVHFPPNIYPPGFTVIFMKVKEKLKGVIGYSESNLDDGEVELFEAVLRRELLNNE